MSTTPQTPKLDPRYDYAKLPDGSYAQFPKGTSQDVMRQKLEAKGLLKPKTSPVNQQAIQETQKQLDSQRAGQVGKYVDEILSGVGRAVKGVTYDAPVGIMDSLTRQVRGEGPYGKSGSLLPMAGMAKEMLIDPFVKATQAREQAKKQGEGVAGQILTTIENYPMGIGEMVKHAEQGGPHMFSPESIGAATEGAAYAAMPKVAEKLNAAVPSKAEAAEAMRRHGGVIESRRLNLPPESGYELGKTKTVGTLEQLATKRDPATKEYVPGKIRQYVETQVKPKVAQGLQQADASGATIDMTSETQALLKEAKVKARPSQMPMLRKAIGDIFVKHDPATGQATPINLKALKPSEAYRLTQVLNDIAFGEDAPPPVYRLARDMRDMVGKKLDQVAPGTSKLRSTESSLIEADKIVSDKYAKKQSGNLKDTVKSVFHAGAPAIVTYMVLRDLGFNYPLAAGGILGLSELYKSTPSVTGRAALWNRVADLLDNPSKAASRVAGQKPAAGGATGAPQGGNALPPSQGPSAAPSATQQPQTTVAQQVTRPPLQLGPSSLAAPATQTPVKPVLESTKPVTPPSPENLGFDNTIKTGPDLGDKVRAEAQGKKVTTDTTKSMSPKTKAMLDRLDTLIERLDSPKSGADRNAILREIEDIKKAVDPKTSEAERSEITKRAQTRDRVAKHRAKAQAETPGASSTAPKEATSQEMSPEVRVALLERGMQELAKYPDGKELAASIAKMPQELQVGALTEALEFLKKHGGEQ